MTADAAWTRRPGTVCAATTADCLPVLFCDRAGTIVAAAHAGWRGLAAGVLEAAVEAMDVTAAELLAWLGPAIGPVNFEVGDDVRPIFSPETRPPIRPLSRSATASGSPTSICCARRLSRWRHGDVRR